MASHKRAFAFMQKWEGGKSSNASDNAAAGIPAQLGGIHTNKGVTWGTYAQVSMECFGHEPSIAHFLTLPDSDVEKIFVHIFWNKIKGDEIVSEKVAMAVVDFAYNAGVSQAVKTLQFLLNTFFQEKLSIDGGLGALTLAALNRADAGRLFTKYNEERIGFYKRLVESKKLAKGFLPGLTNRVNTLTSFCMHSGLS